MPCGSLAIHSSFLFHHLDRAGIGTLVINYPAQCLITTAGKGDFAKFFADLGNLEDTLAVSLDFHAFEADFDIGNRSAGGSIYDCKGNAFGSLHAFEVDASTGLQQLAEIASQSLVSVGHENSIAVVFFNDDLAEAIRLVDAIAQHHGNTTNAGFRIVIDDFDKLLLGRNQLRGW